ncbi:hypothetical protein D3C71_885200 [compost metagenome]
MREHEHQVQARQPVGVGLARIDRQHFLAGRTRAVEVVGLRTLVGAHHLHADVAAHAHLADIGVDVGAHPGGAGLFLHRPRLGNQVVQVGHRIEHHVAVHRARHVPGRNGAKAGKAQVDRAVLQVAGDVGIALVAEQDVAFGLGLVLATIGVVHAHVQVGEPLHRLGQREGGLQAGALEPVFHLRHLAVARAVDGVGQEQRIGVGVVQARADLREAVRAHAHPDRIQLRHRRELQVVFQVQFVAGGLGVVDVGDDLDLLEVELVVPAERVDLVLALVVHAAHQRVHAGGHAPGEGAVGVELRVGDQQARAVAAVVVAEVDLELVGRIDLLGFGMERIQRAGPHVRRAELHGGHHAVTLVVAGAAQRLDAVGKHGARGQAGAVALVGLLGGPRLIQAHLVLLDRHVAVRVANRDAQGVVHELVDVAGAEAVAVRVHVGGLAQRALLVAAADGDHALGEAQRAHGLHVDGARQALADQRGIGGLVDHHAVDQLGRILVELDAAVVAGADHFTPVEQGGGEIRRQAAHADHLRTTGHTLCGKARQARDRFGDADVGQLADVLGGDGFDHRGGVLLGGDGAFDAATDAGDLHGIQVGGGGAGRRGGGLRGLCCCQRRRQYDGQRDAQRTALVVQHFPLPGNVVVRFVVVPMLSRTCDAVAAVVAAMVGSAFFVGITLHTYSMAFAGL